MGWFTDWGANLLGTSLNAAGSITSTLLNNAAARELNEKNIELQEKTNAQNYQLQKEQWARDDSAIQRTAKDLEAAGLSKTLAAGSSTNSTLSTSYVAPRASQAENYSSLQNAFNVYSNFLNNRYVESQIENQESQVELNKANTADVLSKTPYGIAYLDSLSKEAEQRTATNAVQSSLYSAQATYYNTMTPVQANKVLKETEQIESNINLALSNIAVNNGVIDLHKAQTALYGSQSAKNYSDISVNDSNIRRNASLINLTEAQTNKIAYEISESVARTNYLNKEAQKAVYDSLNSFLQYQMSSFNFKINQSEGTKTTEESSKSRTMDFLIDVGKNAIGTALGAVFGFGFGRGARGASYSQYGDYSDIKSWRLK